MTRNRQLMRLAVLLGLLIVTQTISIIEARAQDTPRFSGKRSKVINFEDEVVEGINRKSLDSVSQITEQNRKKKLRLYQKRAGFHDLNQEMIDQVRLTQ